MRNVRLTVLIPHVQIELPAFFTEFLVRFGVDLGFSRFRHSPSVDSLRGASLRIGGMSFIGHRKLALPRFAKVRFRQFVARFCGEFRHHDICPTQVEELAAKYSPTLYEDTETPVAAEIEAPSCVIVVFAPDA